MKQDWQILTKMIGNKDFVVTKINIPEGDISIEGNFELPPLARLSNEDQIFMAAFVKTSGSIKEMERLFGISYPTVKGRLKKISEKLDFVNVSTSRESIESPLELLDRGEITFEEALKDLER